ncbi:hypothetical protein PV367_29955 [Streptomyces europaeiscabiei]|jgi:hypothetical protein|uniref:Uncharacterized protein n=1 Tax=Streptomyces europaeiscabiei TaxID=146819 RepID=A0AAJ2PVA2_9ACTN|nr:hypothetical protein [Streptomyces europaeiscabiei]MDX3133913.1 hypothetical protein [Streptomyces europaeiscabiei]
MTTNDRVQHKEDAAFFDEVKAVSERYPEAKLRYAIANLALENEMGIDYDRQVGVSRIEDGRIVRRFVDRDDPILARMRLCLLRDIHGNCLDWMEAPE